MRLCSFTVDGRAGFGAFVDGDIVDLTHAAPGCDDLRDVLRTAGGLQRLADHLDTTAPRLQPGDVVFLPPIPNPGKIVCAGSNYQAHRDESTADLPAVATHPTIFTRFSDSVSGHEAKIEAPTDELDFEGEIAVVIGTPASKLTTDNALDTIVALGPFNDLSVRDWQRHTSQWTPGKNFEGVGSFGPWITTVDEYPDLRAVSLTTRVNGIQRQHAPLADLVFDLAALLVYVTAFTPLSPGDVLVTGTPGGVGVGSRPPVYLQRGDTVEVEVTGAGTLRNQIV